jgi:hypothetical protein
MIKKFLAIAGLFTIGACAQIGQFSAQDAQQAAAIATAVGDTTSAQCFTGIGTVSTAIGGASQPGILTAIESKFAFQHSLQNPACAPIWVNVLAELLKAGVPSAAAVVP